MNTKEITPPDIVRALFPIKGNEAKLTDAAIRFGVVAYPNSNIILYEGDIASLRALKDLLVGGVTA